MTRFKPGPESARAFRDALGAFATGVTIVTTRTEHGPLGITANSFSSVSIDPPLVLWSPAKSSRRYAPFAAAERFAIHVLGAEQADICEAFVKDGDAFADFETTNLMKGVPLIENCLARFECALFAQHDAGDHTVIIGEVVAAETRPGEPLVFARGRYGRFTGAY